MILQIIKSICFTVENFRYHKKYKIHEKTLLNPSSVFYFHPNLLLSVNIFTRIFFYKIRIMHSSITCWGFPRIIGILFTSNIILRIYVIKFLNIIL